MPSRKLGGEKQTSQADFDASVKAEKGRFSQIERYGDAMRVQIVATIDIDTALALRNHAKAEGLKVTELLRRIISEYMNIAADAHNHEGE